MKVYFIGIGGAGLSALAFMCKQLGYDVSGSDIQCTDTTDRLEQKGIKVLKISKENISSDINLIITSAAISPTQPSYAEIAKAKELSIRVERREYLINQIIKDKISIGVCGTHGKTTTTSLLTHCLIEMGEDPSYLIGGLLQTSGKNADLGTGKYFVWEADEYSNAFHGVHLTHTILNNIEYDHPDFFKSEDEYKNSFKRFVDNNISNFIVANADDSNIDDIMHAKFNTISFGLALNNELSEDEKGINYCSNNINYGHDNTQFIITHDSEHFFIMSLLHGRHNVYNVTAVFALLHSLAFKASNIISAISTFQGSNRRFETLLDTKNVKVISDYAHHPTAINLTIEGAKAFGLPVIAVFEPHQYSRLTTLFADFCNAFTKADEVIILPIYAARETNVPTNFSEDFTKKIVNLNKRYIKNYTDLLEIINTSDNRKKLFLCMSAGPLDEFLRKNLV